MVSPLELADIEQNADLKGLADVVSTPEIPDHCVRRLAILDPDLTAYALTAPTTRRLFVERCGYLVDDHGHLMSDSRPERPIFIVCVSGSAWLYLEGSHYEITPGTAFAVHAHAPHAFVSKDQPWAAWWCTLLGSDVGGVLTEMGIPAANPVVRLANVERVVSVIDEIATVYEREADPAIKLEASLGAWKLLNRVASGLTAEAPVDPVARAIEFLTERFRGDVRIPEISTLVGISSGRLNALFREATGGGVLAYVIGLRMAEARTLLTESDHSITEVARRAGYDDPYYFSREFHRRHGMSPSDFRSGRASLGRSHEEQ